MIKDAYFTAGIKSRKNKTRKKRGQQEEDKLSWVHYFNSRELPAIPGHLQ